MLAAITPAILAGTGATGPAFAAAIGSVDRAVAGLPPHLQDEVAQLLALLASWPGRRWVAGVGVPWRQASVAEVSAFLERWRFSRWALLQQGYHALHDLVLRGVVRAAGQLAGNRLSRAARGRVIRDPIREGLAAGWKVTDAAALDRDLALDADVAIVGTGAGGGVTAEILAAAGLDVVLIEEGALRSSSDFHMLEAEAYPQLYQESAARKTLDKAITILQGRCVGGSTTVNWTSSFRTPAPTLAYWRDRFGLVDLSPAALAPWFERMEERLAIREWTVPPNENNAALARGAARLGIATGAIRRNVSGCWNIGYCGMGCPTNAKQSMLVTTIPAALARGARLVCGARADRLALRGGRAAHLECSALDPRGVRPAGPRVRIRARHYVLAAGAIGTPALLLRSGAPDPHRTLGRRTFLHPTVVSAAVMPQRIDGYAGAPQTVYSDHFLERGPIDGPIGFKLEAPPLHPVLFGDDAPGIRGSARRAGWRSSPARTR